MYEDPVTKPFPAASRTKLEPPPTVGEVSVTAPVESKCCTTPDPSAAWLYTTASSFESKATHPAEFVAGRGVKNPAEPSGASRARKGTPVLLVRNAAPDRSTAMETR